MKFGYGLITCQLHPDDPRPAADIYNEAIELAEEAEELGFDSVWTSEHHFQDDAYLPSVLPLSAAIAARTSRIDIGTAIALAPLYSPLRLAEDAATVDNISNGRFILGLGLGWLEWEFEALGVPVRERVKRTVEAIEVCRQAWGDGLVEEKGVAVTPKPARPGGPPIWIGAGADPALRRAAKLGDGIILSQLPVETFSRSVNLVKEELAALDKTDFDNAGLWLVFTWDDGGAWENVRPHLHYMAWKYRDSEQSQGRIGPLPRAPVLSPSEEESFRSGLEESFRSNLVCGTPEQVVEQIGKMSDVAGPRFTFIGRHYFPGMDRDMMRRSTRLFAEQVIPALR